jgi:hypothetical protein
MNTNTGDEINHEWIEREYPRNENTYLHIYVDSLLQEIERLNDGIFEAERRDP